MLARAKETMASRGETGEKARSEAWFPCRSVRSAWTQLAETEMLTVIVHVHVHVKLPCLFWSLRQISSIYFNSLFQVFYLLRFLVHEILHGASSLLEYHLALEIKREEKRLGKRIRKIFIKTVELQTCEKDNSFIALTIMKANKCVFFWKTYCISWFFVSLSLLAGY